MSVQEVYIALGDVCLLFWLIGAFEVFVVAGFGIALVLLSWWHWSH